MNLYELIRFDILRYKHPRTMPEEVAYQELLTRVKHIADGTAEETIDNATVEDKEKHGALCSAIASRIFKDLALYGPAISGDVSKILLSVLKLLGRNPETK